VATINYNRNKHAFAFTTAMR